MLITFVTAFGPGLIFSMVKRLGRMATDVQFDQLGFIDMPLRRTLVEHHHLLNVLGQKQSSFAERLSVLLKLTQIQLIFFAHMW